MLVSSARTGVQPSYRQLYLRRGDAPWASARVSEGGYDRALDAADGFAYVGTSMWGYAVEVALELHDGEPPVRGDADRITEVSLTGSGPLGVFGWGDDEPQLTFELPEGPLRLRASFFGLAAADAHPDNDLAGEELSPEGIVLELWPALPGEPVAVRAWAR